MIELVKELIGYVQTVLQSQTIFPSVALLSTGSLIETFWKYLPFAPFLILAWPIVITILFSFASTSTWVFWLLTSLIFGSIQLVYVVYQFTMIGVDLGGLSILKTFASIRSLIRYYTIKSGFDKRYNTMSQRNGYVSKRGRKSEWRKKLDLAKSFPEFLDIDIQEPVNPHPNIQEPKLAVSTKNITKSAVVRVGEEETKDESNRATIKATNANSNLGMTTASSCENLEHATLPLPKSPRRSISAHKFDQDDLVEDEEVERELGMTGSMLLTTTYRLKEARVHTSISAAPCRIIDSIHETAENDDVDDDDEGSHDKDENNTERSSSSHADSALKFLLQGVVKRNHLSVNDLMIGDALSVMESGQHKLSYKARGVIRGYHEEVERCLDWMAQSNVNPQSSSASATPANRNDENSSGENPDMQLLHELNDRRTLMRKLKHNMGRSALMLSGGGAQAMYHVGTLKALCESKLYDDIKVISGTSGGSIVAGMCALHTREELLEHVCVPHVSTDFRRTGQQKRENIRWFPEALHMCKYWLKNKLLVDSKEFKRTCNFYYGDTTFEEAFQKTGKHVCITVSANRAEGGGGSGGGQRLLLNHISTPHVTIASAVAASCALPGVMAPAKLVTKNQDNEKENFEVDGVEWIDGSVQADLPFKRISTLFNVSNYIVCQTNFHVVPFLHKAHHPDTKSFYWRAFQSCEWDIRNRALNLSRLGLFPKLFGQDVSKVFKQKYHGDLTLVPRFTTMQVFGLKALVHPTYEEMEIYLQNGQASAWPYLSVIKEMLRLETAIDKCIGRLNERMDNIAPENDWDEVESITSGANSRIKNVGTRRENELLRHKVHSLELENLEMKKELEMMKSRLGITPANQSLKKSSPTTQIEFIPQDVTS